MRSSAAILENDVGNIDLVEQKALELIRRFNDPDREHVLRGVFKDTDGLAEIRDKQRHAETEISRVFSELVVLSSYSEVGEADGRSEEVHRRGGKSMRKLFPALYRLAVCALRVPFNSRIKHYPVAYFHLATSKLRPVVSRLRPNRLGWVRHSMLIMLRWRQAPILLSLFAVLAVGIVLIRLGDTLRQDEAILEWSNILVSKEIGATSTPRFLYQAIQDNPGPHVWVVSGAIALPDSGYEETRDRYVAVVRQVCEARREKKCWALESLELGGEGQTVSVASVSRDGSVMQSQFAEDAAPPAETTETGGRDISVAGASTRTNKVAIGGTWAWTNRK
jgi:hypothetical protein